jgi:hypothetical protein
MCLSSYGPKEFGFFRSLALSGQESLAQVLPWVVFGPKAQESIAQGLPWVIPLTQISPEGATRYGENWLRTFEPDSVRISSPFGAGPSGRMTGAKHLRSSGAPLTS